MADSYNDGTVFTTAAQHGDLRIDRPLYDRGDTAHLVIYRTMRVQRSSYSPVTQGTALAGFAGTRLVRETPLEPVNADISEYTQIYSTVPTDRTVEFEGSNVFPFPAYRDVIYTPPATEEAADESDDNLWDWREARGANTNPAPLYVDYDYFIDGDPPTIPAVFRPTWNGNEVDFVTNGGSGTLTNAKALNGDTFTAVYSVAASVPSATEYADDIDEGDLLVIDVQIDRYMGDIFVMRTLKMTAQ